MSLQLRGLEMYRPSCCLRLGAMLTINLCTARALLDQLLPLTLHICSMLPTTMSAAVCMSVACMACRTRQKHCAMQLDTAAA